MRTDGVAVRCPHPLTNPRHVADDDDSCRVICDREMHTLHRNVPALRRRDVDTSTIRQHYYPEGGWGWIVCGVGFLVHLLTSGLQLSFGLLYLYTLHHLGDASPMDAGKTWTVNHAEQPVITGGGAPSVIRSKAPQL